MQQQLFTWSYEYSVGDPLIDQQHKEVFELGNQLITSDIKNINLVVLNIFKHVRVHFSHEEEHMKKIGYPSLDDHRKLHDALISDLSAITQKPLDDPFYIKEFQTFIYYWVVDHILKHDKKYFVFSQKNQNHQDLLL